MGQDFDERFAIELVNIRRMLKQTYVKHTPFLQIDYFAIIYATMWGTLYNSITNDTAIAFMSIINKNILTIGLALLVT